MNPVIIDVREKDEFAREHIPHSIHLPLSELNRQAPGIFKNLEGRSFLLMCLSGKRSLLAQQQLAALGLTENIELYEGGIQEWKKQNKPTERSGPPGLPLMRQVQLVAGSLAFLGACLAWFVHPAWVFLPGLVGLGLMTAGATGFCGMAELLARMPWNRAP